MRICTTKKGPPSPFWKAARYASQRLFLFLHPIIAPQTDAYGPPVAYHSFYRRPWTLWKMLTRRKISFTPKVGNVDAAHSLAAALFWPAIIGGRSSRRRVAYQLLHGSQIISL